MGLQGGKMLLRIDPDDAATAPTLAACAAAVGGLASRGLMAMVEPFVSHRVDGRVRNDLATDAVVRSATVAAGLGPSSAHTWLKLPVIDDMEPVLSATTLPVVLLGGEVGPDQDAQFALWQKALSNPQVRGMVVGRSLLYPPDDDVAAAVDAVVEMMR
jgi:DhnA family fructose-bisphosphate aldolase class Ia